MAATSTQRCPALCTITQKMGPRSHHHPGKFHPTWTLVSRPDTPNCADKAWAPTLSFSLTLQKQLIPGGLVTALRLARGSSDPADKEKLCSLPPGWPLPPQLQSQCCGLPDSSTICPCGRLAFSKDRLPGSLRPLGIISCL